MSARGRVVLKAGLIVGVCVGVWFFLFRERIDPVVAARRAARQQKPLRFANEDSVIIDWWDTIPASVRAVSVDTGPASNIRPQDYSGPESCRRCHQKNYEAWSHHPHRHMNALATDETVKGDFSGNAGISHLGGTAEFYRKDDSYRMSLERDGTHREFRITQTIGSRFFQYYVGKQISGPRPDDLPTFEENHVLPFGYWLGPGEWVPVVHVHPLDDEPDGRRTDAFRVQNDTPFLPLYSSGCNHCHTTFPLGDQFVRHLRVSGRHAPQPMHFAMSDYLSETHPELWDGTKHPSELSRTRLISLINRFEQYEAEDHAVTLGISCEACHLGAAEHAQGRLDKPAFFPRSPHLHVESESGTPSFERNHANINWACGRCHAGPRPQFAAGMSTWNSTEYTDAMRGSCYSKLTCIHCHNPHEATGMKWSKTPEQDDQLCLQCHQEFEPPKARTAHTHHPLNSAGSRCMNCHMPHLNEGMQDVVRTHMISSPTNPAMLEANQPNACNQCHPDRNIDWTLTRLDQWYGRTWNERKIASSYPERGRPAIEAWLRDKFHSVRLVAVDSLIRHRADESLPQVIDALDDPSLINRQFARIGVEEQTGIRLEDFGYRFYMTPEERAEPLERIRAHLLESSNQTGARTDAD